MTVAGPIGLVAVLVLSDHLFLQWQSSPLLSQSASIKYPDTENTAHQRAYLRTSSPRCLPKERDRVHGRVFPYSSNREQAEKIDPDEYR